MKNKVKTVQNIPTQFMIPSWHGWLVFLFGAILYINTLSHDFTQDDAIVIYDNMFTTKGVDGIGGLFTEDTFFGFFKEKGKAKLVSGGRYRPFTPAMFALEYELVGKKPWLGHTINMLLYGLLCFVIYQLLYALIVSTNPNKTNGYLVLGISLLYAVHPLHTEAVANIKGRDEIMSMLGSIGALYGILRYFDTSKKKYIYLACIAFFIGLLSKENAITFLAVVPLALYTFRSSTLGKSITLTVPLLIPTFIFLLIRTSILGSDFGGTPMELMNNPYLKLVDGQYVPFSTGERFATIFYTLWKYISLLFIPHPLTHDYYPRYIEMKTFGDPVVLFSFFLHIGLAIFGILGLRKKSIVGFGILYYLITLSIVSNIVFPIGTNMSERFMFMPSLGFAIIVGYLLANNLISKFGTTLYVVILSLLLLLYGMKTVTRNTVWKNDFTLFTTDVHTSVNSAKVLNAAGGALTTEAFKEKDEAKKKVMLSQAVQYLDQAVQIHPTYKNPYLISGNAHYYLLQYEKAAEMYQKALQIDPNFSDAKKNLAISLRDAGRYAGEVEQNLTKAQTLLNKALEIEPNDTETFRLLGVLHGVSGNHKEAITYFGKVVEREPKNANAMLNLSNAYLNAGDQINGQKYRNEALAIDPNILQPTKNKE